jgi:hypothetical protein
MVDNSETPARLTFELLRAAHDGRGEPMPVEWRILGASTESEHVVDRLLALPKPVQCVQIRTGRRVVVTCDSLDAAHLSGHDRNVHELRSRVSLVGRMLEEVESRAAVLVVGRSFSIRMPASDVERWMVEYCLDPEPDFARLPLTPEQLQDVSAKLLLDIPAGGGWGAELVRL